MLLGHRVELAPPDSRFHARSSRFGVDHHALHRGEVDQEASVAHGVAGVRVASSLDGQRQTLLASGVHRGLDVPGLAALHDHVRPPVEASVPDRTGLVVARVSGEENRAADGSVEGAAVDLSHPVSFSGRVRALA